MLSPIYFLGPFFFLLISVPLAICAMITTSIAVTALLIRASVVYFELGVALISSCFFLQKSSPITLPKSTLPPSHSGTASPIRPRSARPISRSSAVSLPDAPNPRLAYKSGSFASLIGTGEPTRDYEGVGGWRVPGEEDEEALWIGMNSRLELPAATPGGRRHHKRSLTGGSQSQRWSWTPEAVRISPMQSRARTPIHSRESSNGPGPDEYFPPQPLSSRFSSGSDLGKHTQDGRRKSGTTTPEMRRYDRVLRQLGD